MVLEAVMILVDNSESSRNGDYQPTRFDSQSDAVGILFQSITQGNPESSVGLMSMGGKGPEVLVTLTTDQGKILDGLHRTKKKIGGCSHLKTGIQVATLALKHRQNRSQRQRIIAFVCSPVEDDEKELTQLAKKMRKANIFVDFVLFGDLEDEITRKKLVAFNDIVKVNDGSHLVSIPASSKLLSDQLISSPILLGEGAGGPSGSAGLSGNEEYEFGVNPELEPELALALRMSLEEENARQEKKAREQEQAAGKTSLASVEEENPSGEGGSKGDKKDDDKMDTS
ncbi:26S proteasome non-ATPase regulatory subunit 4 -like protein [Escovopsis weberi]|uniref:26S proteasome non-ATPase regulatory subunit 4-like protein n=1 Tax=Escovopsis weberi TaxID=150374 RepID=A0A0M8N193_ESCWE|nr:26S proteasome non-ATPase regulatory subunit 4 -like protein [Escovopsis weberi]